MIEEVIIKIKDDTTAKEILELKNNPLKALILLNFFFHVSIILRIDEILHLFALYRRNSSEGTRNSNIQWFK